MRQFSASLPQICLFSFVFADSDIVQNALFLSLNSLCILFSLRHKRASKTRYFSAKILISFLPICRVRHLYFSASIRFPFFLIWYTREFLKRVIFLPKISLNFYLFEDSIIVLNALFLSLNLLCILFHLKRKRASKTRYFSAIVRLILGRNSILFLSICRFRHRFKCFFSLPQITLYILLFATQESF